MHMRRSHIAIGLAVTLFALVFSSITMANELTFLVAGYAAATRHYVQNEVFPAFRDRYGVDVILLNSNWNTRMERFMVLTAGGTPPDVVVTGSYSAYEEGSLGLLEPLDRYLAQWRYTPRFPAALWDSLKWQGQVMAVPQSVNTRGMGYNKELFGQSGLDPEKPPADWNELTQYVRRLTRIEGDRTAVLGYQATGVHSLAQEFFWFIRQTGVPEADIGAFKSNLLQPEAIEALQQMQGLYDAGGNDRPAFAGGFAQRRVAIRPIGSSSVPSLLAEEPQIMNETGIFAPRRGPGSPPVAHVFPDGLAITSASKNKDTAWDFISFMLSDEISLGMQQEVGFFSGRTDILQRIMRTQPYMGLWYDIFPYMQSSITPPPRDVSQTELVTQIDRVYKKEISPLVALEQAHNVWTRLLGEWKTEIGNKRVAR